MTYQAEVYELVDAMQSLMLAVVWITVNLDEDALMKLPAHEVHERALMRASALLERYVGNRRQVGTLQ